MHYPLLKGFLGSKKFLIIYVIAGIFGNAASFAFSSGRSVGASGAIFGMLGALLYFGIEKPQQFKMFFKQGVIFSLLVNIAYGLSNPIIDNYAHLGGLLGGFLVAGSTRIENFSQNLRTSAWYIFSALAILIVLLKIGFGG